MSIFSIADLHLSHTTNKPMDKFGSRWRDHTEKLEKRWRAVVAEDDTVVVPGDISWAMTLDEALSDFRFIDSLPGRKLIGKGNHDYWWTTLAKMERFFTEKGITSIDFLYNNAFTAEGAVICGTRGWYVDGTMQSPAENADYGKIVLRECERLKLSLNDAVRLRDGSRAPLLCYFHFPPVFRSFICRELVDVLHAYDVKRCFFGHIHGDYTIPKTIFFEDISMTMISADFLDFIPMITTGGDY